MIKKNGAVGRSHLGVQGAGIRIHVDPFASLSARLARDVTHTAIDMVHASSETWDQPMSYRIG